MKKTIAIALASTMMLLSGCGNMDFVDWHWTFDKARIKVDENKWEEVSIKKWHDYDGSDMIAIETEDHVYVTHSANVILIKSKKEGGK